MTYTNKVHKITNGTMKHIIITAIDENGKEIAFKWNGKVIPQTDYKKLVNMIRYGYSDYEIINKIK